MGAFSNFAISLSIICILAGGVTSFHQGLSSVGGAAFGLGWPLVCLFSLAVAATMGQVASSFPTAGGLYHWASILGGKGWGWATAWLNLLAIVAALAAITTTGFDASANTAEETVGAAVRVPRGIIQAVAVSGVAGWVMLCAVVAAIPDLDRAAALGPGAFTWTVGAVLPRPLAYFILAGIAVAQYLCGLAAVTSASRIAYAFARDGGLPASKALGRVSDRYRAPTMAIWTVALAAALATVYTPIYETMAAVAAILLYISYVLPTALGLVAYGHRWTTMGPWDLGAWYRPLAAISVVGCQALIAIGMHPPNEKSIRIIGGGLPPDAVIWLWGCKYRSAAQPGP